MAVDGDAVARIDQAADLDLQALQRSIHIAHRATRSEPSSPITCQGSSALRRIDARRLDGELAEPWGSGTRSAARTSGIERHSRRGMSSITSSKSISHEGGQQEAVVQLGAPAHQRRAVGLAPEARDQRAQQQLLDDAHAGMRRHLEGTQLQQAQAAGGRVRRVELVDAELAAVRVAGGVDQNIAQRAVHDPGWHAAGHWQLGRLGVDFVRSQFPARTTGRCAPRPHAGPGWSGR